MKYFPIYSTIIVILLTSCFKRDETEVNIPCNENCITFYGTIATDQYSETPIKDAFIELGWNEPGIPIGNPGRLIATGKSDKNGYYSFTFKPDSIELISGKYYLNVFKDGYFDVSNSYYNIETIDTTYNINIHIPSKAKLIIKYKNFNPKLESDYFSASPHFDTYGSIGHAIKMYDSNGKQKNTHFLSSDSSFNECVLSGETAGNQYTYFYILIKKDGSRVDKKDSIFIKRNETGIFEIEY